MTLTELTDNLTNIMAYENTLYEELLNLSSLKTDFIIGNSIEQLEACMKKEYTITSKIKKSEALREKVVHLLSTRLSLSENATLYDIIQKMGRKTGANAVALYKKMAENLINLAKINQTNAKLIQNHLNYIDFSINLMSGTGAGDNNYSAKGYQSDKSSSGKGRYVFKV